MICPLCELEVAKFHPNSHIVPEWMYENSYDDIHRVVSLNLDQLHKDIVQKGIRGAFICNDCESRFSKDDDYGCRLMTDKVKSSQVRKGLVIQKRMCDIDIGRTEVSFWSNFEFKRFQNFVLSVLIRDHLWRKSEGRAQLNDEHYQRIKALYFDANKVDDTLYPIQIIELAKGGIDAPVFLPFVGRFFECHRAYAFAGSGYIFHVWISSHKKPDFLESQKVQKNGSALIAQIPFEKTAIFKNCLPKILKIKAGDSEK